MRLRPVLDGDFWLIGASPDLSWLGDTGGAPEHECVDHQVYQDTDGRWHLWSCIRRTCVGRILYHWESDTLVQSPWRDTGEAIRVNRAAGESLDDWNGEEWIQSPFVVRHSGSFYMFYGGHSTARDVEGHSVPSGDPRTACQMCLTISEDGRQWARYRNEDGLSRLFVGPGETRDPCVLKVGDCWHLYYAGYHDEDRAQAGFYVRTSHDLLQWSDWRLVHQDRRYGPGPWDTECPHVVFRGGAFYLFRTEDYATARTHVFRSEDPFDFGVGDARDQYVGSIAVAAPEIVVADNGDEYITSNHDLRGGTMMCRLRWERA